MEKSTDILTKKEAILHFIRESNNPMLISKLKEVVDSFGCSKQEDTMVPEWQKEEVTRRTSNYKDNPASAVDFDLYLNELEDKYEI